MQYQGGKSRIAKPISEVIINEVSRWKVKDSKSNSIYNREMGGGESNQTLVSLFCGSCAVEAKLAPHFNKVICNDNGEYINPRNGEKSPYNCEKWKFLLDAPFKISDKCCYVMKKNPAHKFDKQRGFKPIIATMTEESVQRETKWLKQGCNSFDLKNPASKPMSFWTEQDVLKYIMTYDIPIASVYGEIKQDDNGKYYTTGCNRTGCVFCGFGCHLEKEPNRFQQLKETHPKIYEYCMKSWDEGGLGMDEVLNYINVKH